MKQFQIEHMYRLIAIVTIGLAGPLALTGCNSGSSATPVDQAIAGHDAAKSSMDYMKKHRSETSKAAKNVQSKGR